MIPASEVGTQLGIHDVLVTDVRFTWVACIHLGISHGNGPESGGGTLG